jgi:hypothetical protein
VSPSPVNVKVASSPRSTVTLRNANVEPTALAFLVVSATFGLTMSTTCEPATGVRPEEKRRTFVGPVVRGGDSDDHRTGSRHELQFLFVFKRA